MRLLNPNRRHKSKWLASIFPQRAEHAEFALPDSHNAIKFHFGLHVQMDVQGLRLAKMIRARIIPQASTTPRPIIYRTLRPNS
jgi:hypothetical protein